MSSSKIVRADHLSLVVADAKRPRADNLCHRREHAGGDLALGTAQRHEVLDRVLNAGLSRPPPQDANDRRWSECEQERKRAGDPERRAGKRCRGIRPASRRGCKQRDGEQTRREGEDPHPPARHDRLAPARSPQPRRGDRRQNRPVDQETRQVCEEPAASGLTGLGKMSQGERPHDHRQRHQPKPALERRRRRPEDGREPVQQVREEQQERDVEPLEEVLDDAVRMVGNDRLLAKDDHDPERPETNRGPRSCAVALPSPLVDRGERQHHVSREADVAENLDRKLQKSPPGPPGARPDCTPRRHRLHAESLIPAGRSFDRASYI